MYRILARSVRGHEYLIGNPSVRPIAGGAVPSGVGTTLATLQNVRGYVARELRELSSFYAVRVVDTDGVTVANGVRGGLNGTGRRWWWEYPTTV